MKLRVKDIEGVEFFTSSYGNLKKIDKGDYFIVSVSIGDLSKELKKTYGEDKGRDYFYDIDMMLGKKLGPSWKIYSKYKNSVKPQKQKELEYYNSFTREVLGKVDLEELILKITEKACKQGKTRVVFLCYETHREFCHRFILAEKLNMFVLEKPLKELFVGDKRQIFLKGRLVLEWCLSQKFYFLRFFLK